MPRQHLLGLQPPNCWFTPLVHLRSSACAKPAMMRNAMSDFSRDVKPDNSQRRFAARRAHLLGGQL